MGEPSGKRSLHLRLEAKQHDQLQQLATENGSSITDLVRELLERALGDQTHLALLAHTKATEQKIGSLQQTIATMLPALHQRMGTLERLVCTADANAVRRSQLDHAKRRRLYRPLRYALWELQQIALHLLQQSMHTNGHTHEQFLARHTDCEEISERDVTTFMVKMDKACAEIDAGAPAPLQPPPAPALEIDPATTHRQPDDWLDNWVAAIRRGDPDAIPVDRVVNAALSTVDFGPLDRARAQLEAVNRQLEAKPGEDQPGLFDAASEAHPTPVADQTEASTAASPALPNGTVNGAAGLAR